MSKDAVENRVIELLAECRKRNFKVATAESCTGGLIAAALTSVAGSSDVVDRGFISYSNEAKIQMLGVSSKTLDRYGSVSSAVAKEMAYGALVNSMADITVAITGIAGPDGGTAEKPVGTVWIAICEQGHAPQASLMEFGDIGRDKIRYETVKIGLSLLFQHVTGA